MSRGPPPRAEPFSLQIKSCLGQLDVAMREEVSGQANMSPEGREDKSRKSPSQQPFTKHLYKQVLQIPAVIITSLTEKEIGKHDGPLGLVSTPH